MAEVYTFMSACCCISSSRRQICMAHLHTKVSQTRLLPYAHSNRLRLNCSRVLALRMFEGRPFQVEGPAMRKLQLPKRVVSARGSTRSPWSADHSRDRAATVCTHHADTSDLGRGERRMWSIVCWILLQLILRNNHNIYLKLVTFRQQLSPYSNW